MISAVIGFAIALAVSVTLTPLVRKLARDVGAIDQPGGRRVHRGAIPRLGGIAIALGFGWALSITAAPNATAALLVAGATGIPSTTLTWKWNGVYSLCAMVVFAMLCWLMIGG